MKNISTLLVLLGILLCNKLNAQFILLDDMEGNGRCSGKWTYYAGTTTTGKVQFNVPNPDPSGINTSSHVAKFLKDTSCFEYMSTGCSLTDSFDLSTGSVFKMLVYCSTKDEIMFKLQPGDNYGKAVFFTYKVTQINHWEEATFNFQSVKQRTDFNRVEVHYIDGKKAAGLLYFDLVQAPDPTGITLTNASIPMGQENGTIIQAKLHGDTFQTTLAKTNWTSGNLPPGVTISQVQRVNDTMANIILGGNSPANYSRTTLQLSVSGQEFLHPAGSIYPAKGKVIFEGNPNWTMVYNDEFSSDGLPDRTKWTVDPRPKGWINGEQQVYTDTTHDNIRVKDGRLIIKGKKDFPTGNANEPWSSGRLISQNKMDFLYGKVEVKAKLPRAHGSWPAIWLMPTTSAYGAWPKSGEIDIMEHVGNNLGTVLSTVHTQNNNWMNGGHLSANLPLPDADTTFHVYSLEWTPDSLRFTYDSTRCYTYANPQTDWKDWPFDQKFHVILNLAIGGGMGGNIIEGDWPDSMTIDYVRIYQKGLGTPILDTIVVSPANLSFVAGKTQQYTAAASDQNGHAIAITPVWSITGTGNTITAGGLATLNTTGTITATATVDTVTVSGSTNVNVRATNYKPIPVKIETENYDNSNVCCTEPTSDTGGGLNVSYIGAGTWFDYDLDIPDSASYRIQFRVAVSTATSIKIMDDTTTLQTVNLPASGGWQNWITVTSAPLTLKAGQKTIRLYSNASGYNFNWINITYADSITLSRIAVTPDTAMLITEQTRQFTATGYDADSNRMVITPLWSVTPAGAGISATGLFSSTVPGNYIITATADGITDTATVQVKQSPILTRISLTPDTVTVPLGAAQQFTVKGYDQYDSIKAITPIWTVSGAGNTISNTGIFTAGNTPGTYTITATADSISATAIAVTGYTCTVNNKTEAESASSYASGPYLQTCTDVGGGQNFTNLTTGNWFAYSNLNVPVAGRYTISFRISSTVPAQVNVGHSGMTFGTINLPSTGGVWKTISDTITLPALTYTGLHVKSGTWKINWFSIDNCAHDTTLSTAGVAAKTTVTGAESSVYPNPTAGPVTIELRQQYKQVSLLDIQGNVLRQWNIRNGETRISKDLSFLPGGTYLLKLEGGKQPATFRIIKL
jgi:beta-glucanase (GH16 family)